jgi:RimJ/RimL family protein N-acetyltransferase
MREAPILRTERLTLRPFDASDPAEARAVLGYAGQPGFFRYLDHVPLEQRQAYTLAHAAQHLLDLERLAGEGWPHWAIVPDGVGVPVGAVRFHPAFDGSEHPELGYGLGPAWWGRGYATEACAAVLAWAAPDTPVVVARCHPGNAASRRVLARLGFEPLGLDARGRLSSCWRAPQP